MTTIASEPLARRNALLLACAHAILGSQLNVHIILGGLAGALVAPQPHYATVPISAMLIASMCCTAPISLLMGWLGRRPVFLMGALCGAIGGSIAAYAITIGSFAWLLLGSACLGIYQATNGYFRFAAADTATETFRPKAISWVLAGGLGAALLGPELVRQTRDLLSPVPYAGTYLALIGLNIVGSLPVLFLQLPKPARTAASGGRRLGEIVRTRPILTAIVCGMTSYALMILVMTSTPLAMVTIGCTPDQAADVVRWHVVAMFFPSFFTGNLIVRFGHIRIIGTGFALLATASLIALSGETVPHFYAVLILLGVGWNFGFVGSTSLLAANHAPAERARVQGLNDFLVFGLVAVASVASGALLSTVGWNAVQYAMAPAVVVAVGMLCWLAVSHGRYHWLRV